MDTEMSIVLDENDQDDPNHSLKRQKLDDQAPSTTPNEPNISVVNANYGSLLGGLWDQDFADVTVKVGGCDQEYHLHRNVLCSESPFFKAACKSSFREGISRHIDLPTIKPQTFEQILVWLYTSDYELPEKGDHDTIFDLYSAADYLGILGLKRVILEQTTNVLHRDFNLVRAKQLKNSEIQIPHPYNLIKRLVRESSVSEFEIFQPVMTELVNYYPSNEAYLKYEAAREENDNFFWALMVDSYFKILHANFCHICRAQLKSKLESGDKCKGCKKTRKA
ncbi:hypothetical protein TWF694_003390 [Orbilia ellipsospora]|uniref:BTB domain-containing protein n=1 Tax=Orbilia ellipsospora TaxID=2528407 RepID=A0AAV9X076_9PEZI